MSDLADHHPPAKIAALHIAPKAGHLVVVAVCAFGAALYVPNVTFGLILFSAGLTLLFLGAIAMRANLREEKERRSLHSAISTFVANDVAASFTTDKDGRIVHQNEAARLAYGDDPRTLSETLEGQMTSARATLQRLRAKAEAKGQAREDVVARSGMMRVSAHQMPQGHLLWRLEDLTNIGARQEDAETISMPMMTVSKAGTVLFMNEGLRKLLGGRVGHLNKIITDLPLRPDQVHRFLSKTGEFRARVQVVEASVGRREIFIMPQADEPDVNYSWDMLEQLPVPIMKVGTDGAVISSNLLARELLRFDNGKQQYLGDLVEGLGRSVADWLENTANAPHGQSSEFVRATRPSSEMFLQITISRVTDEAGQALVVTLNDATKLKTLEAQFVQSQKMQAIGQLAGGVAHDFNNLLTAISGHCDLLMLRHEEGDADHGDLTQISQNANRAASLVGQLLAFSRKQTLKPEVLDLHETLNDVTHLLSRLVGEKVVLSFNHDPDLLPIRADKRQLEQVIMNLVVNARDAMPEGGDIQVETRIEDLRERYERDQVSVPPGKYVVISVRDHGHGIAPEKLPKIFEPFYTTKKTGEGTGLGLSMAYGIVKQTGGYIFADSIVGSGTTFTLLFPAHTHVEPAITAAPRAAPQGTKSHEGGVVLLVEDEAPVRAFASRALKMRGYTVVEADCAENALKTLEDPELNVDVFVTDVIMPGMDGPSWVAKALEDRPDTRVVFVSGYAEDSFSDQQARIPNSVFLPKPFSLSELTSTVQAQIA